MPIRTAPSRQISSDRWPNKKRRLKPFMRGQAACAERLQTSLVAGLAFPRIRRDRVKSNELDLTSKTVGNYPEAFSTTPDSKTELGLVKEGARKRGVISQDMFGKLPPMLCKDEDRPTLVLVTKPKPEIVANTLLTKTYAYTKDAP